MTYCNSTMEREKMEKIKKIRVYLDYNIYDSIVKEFVKDDILKNNNIKVHLSVGHAEEHHKALKNDKNKENVEILNKIFDEMILLTPNGVLNPGKTRIINKYEKFQECINRVKEYDTGDIVIEHGKNLNKIQKESVNSYMEKNNKVMNFSNLSLDEIWEQKEIIEGLIKFSEYIEKYKVATFKQIENLYGYNSARKICNINHDGFEMKKDCYSSLQQNYKLLECVIEYLHILLSECGYKRDKTDRTTISGIHDVQHSIYATYCDYFISEDKSFAKRTSAIYKFLGIKTKIISFYEFKDIIKNREWIDNIN